MCAEKSSASHTLVYQFNDRPIEGIDTVEFRLLYQGPLGSSAGPNEKHGIRRSFHPQLRRLWQTNSGLRDIARMQAPWGRIQEEPPLREWTEEELAEQGLKYISEQWQRGDYKFIPLVTRDACLRCSIEILFLRPGEPRFVIQGGDLDNRLKTLFDALRIPANQSEMGNATLQDDETPFYCLLQDDILISEVRVITDELLALPAERMVRANDVFLEIYVRLKPTKPTQFSAYLD